MKGVFIIILAKLQYFLQFFANLNITLQSMFINSGDLTVGIKTVQDLIQTFQLVDDMVPKSV